MSYTDHITDCKSFTTAPVVSGLVIDNSKLVKILPCNDTSSLAFSTAQYNNTITKIYNRLHVFDHSRHSSSQF